MPIKLARTTFIHYGHDKFDIKKFEPIKNRIGWNKPNGGLWASPIKTNWGWKDWCEAEDFRECKEENSFKINLSLTCKILLINKYDDINEIKTVPCDFDRYTFDFEELQKRYDVVWLTESGLNETHLTGIGKKDLYGWDCESLLIMNPKCIIQIQYEHIERNIRRNEKVS